MQNHDIERAIAPYLLDGEELLWTGRPKGGLILRRADIFLIPFSMVWGGFACFWEFLVLFSDAPKWMALFGLPFVFIGLYLMFGRFIWDAKRRAKTVYGLSHQRLFVLREGAQKTISSFRIKDLPQAQLQMSRDGRGSIRFGFWANFFPPNFRVFSVAPPQAELESIEDPERVFKRLQEIQSGLKPSLQ